VSEKFLLQPYNLSPSVRTTNSPTAYAVWPGSEHLSANEREAVVEAVMALKEIVSCNWDGEGRLLLVRERDLRWSGKEGPGEKACKAVADVLAKSFEFEVGGAK